MIPYWLSGVEVLELKSFIVTCIVVRHIIHVEYEMYFIICCPSAYCSQALIILLKSITKTEGFSQQ
jgi:hypothetical protein